MEPSQRSVRLAEPSEHDVLFAGIPTRIVTTCFADRVFMVISQCNSLGNMITARVNEGPAGGHEVEVKSMLGRRDADMLLVIARQLVTAIHLDVHMPLLLAIALKDEDMPMARAVVDFCKRVRPWLPKAEPTEAHAPLTEPRASSVRVGTHAHSRAHEAGAPAAAQAQPRVHVEVISESFTPARVA